MTLSTMKKYAKPLSKVALIAVLAAMILSSCVPMRRIRYLQEEENKKSEKLDFKNDKGIDYLIHSGDNLYIKVTSLDEKTNSFDKGDEYNNYYTEAAIYLNSYTVNDSGFVEFPLIGKIFVNNFTVDEVRENLQQKVNEYVKNTIVIVKLANFRISMFGEFKNPGKYVVYQDNINIFEAIAMAGDMTDFAKKDHVLLIRQTDTGSKAYRINLNDKSILESDLYYLMPNDLIYVEPVKGKQFAFSEFPYLLLLTTITTTLLTIEFIKNN
jgi:polysaccharide export outer membrane protein